MRSFLPASCAALALPHVPASSAFAVVPGARPTATAAAAPPPSSASLRMSSTSDGPSRRSFLGKAASAAALSNAIVQLGPSVEPANAIGGGLKKVNAKLAAYGLPSMPPLPDGFTPLLEIYGKASNREPLLVQFAHPLDWVVTLPNVDVNGEDGTIQAGEYGKGDTATLFVYTDPGKVKNIADQPKSFFEEALIKAISQKGSSIYQNFKVTKIEPTRGEYGDQTYVICDFKYELITGAGFEVDRRAVASVTSQGNAVELLWCASTRQRYKQLEPKLRAIAGSFRVHSDGLDLAVQRREDKFA